MHAYSWQRVPNPLFHENPLHMHILLTPCCISHCLPAMNQQTCNFTKNELHTYFPRILARFEVIIYCVLEFQDYLFF